MEIYRRTVFEELIKYLDTAEAIILHGARQVGKTCILLYLKRYLEEKKELTHYIDLEDSRFVRILDAGPQEFFKYLLEEGFDLDILSTQRKKIFVLIDEIQYLKNPSSFLKIIVDHYPSLKIIVSGSSTFDIRNKFKDSLVGRTVNFNIFNLSFQEFLLFKGYPFNGEMSFTKKKEGELKSLYQEYALFGGYPKIVLTPDVEMKEKYLQQIIDTYVKKDIRDLAVIKDIDKFNKILEVLASQSGQLLNTAELANTCSLAKKTVENHLFLLEQTYVIKLVRPYSTNLRTELFRRPKIFFYDTGLMQMLWLKGLQKQILGPVFETSIFAELVKKYGAEKVNFWRTTDKKEIDFILRKKNEVLPIEVKMNLTQFNPTAIRYFLERYHLKGYQVICLEGEVDNRLSFYPWRVGTP
ncbi:MAG: ATP-binding protein [Candidatus Omnitrophota bacterium]